MSNDNYILIVEGETKKIDEWVCSICNRSDSEVKGIVGGKMEDGTEYYICKSCNEKAIKQLMENVAMATKEEKKRVAIATE